MTLEEYEKVREEKRKALLAMKNEERKVEIDEELQSMKQLSVKKGNDDVFVKLVSVLWLFSFSFVIVHDIYVRTSLLIYCLFHRVLTRISEKRKKTLIGMKGAKRYAVSPIRCFFFS